MVAWGQLEPTLSVRAGESKASVAAAVCNSMKFLTLLFLISCIAVVRADEEGNPDNSGRVATLSVGDLREYSAQPPQIQRLLSHALALTTQNLSYKYGSCDPKSGGMDCSGTVYYLLQDAGVKDVPRDASEMYKWVWTRSRFRAVVSPNLDSFEFAALKPGDLLFWTGTNDVDRDPPVTHVMIYLGVNRLTGRRVMVGASEGRRFNDVSRYGVSVFDLELPRKRAAGDPGTSRFIGYGAIPDFVAAEK
jgi:hypothetical protein